LFTTLQVNSPSFSGRIVRLFDTMLLHQDEPASPRRDDSQGEACPTDSGFIADQDRATIAKSSTLPCNSAPRVTSPAAEEGTNVLAGETNIPTGSGSIPIAGAPATIVSTGSEVGPTASLIVQRRKGKE
nr:hypothetical protein [Tanacetum cinerariifolium]